MSILVDTSGLYALLDEGDREHARAAETWRTLLRDEQLVTHDRVVVEATALVQGRLGMRAATQLHRTLLASMEVLDVDEVVRAEATARWMHAGRRGLSLVDVTSFVVMERAALAAAFAFDDDFVREGFTVVPGPA